MFPSVIKMYVCFFVIFLTIANGQRIHDFFNTTESTTVSRSDLECEFPPKSERDLTHLRRKRMTAENGLVCLEDYPYTVSIRLHGKHWCGGAIVGKLWVISAAQCFDYIMTDEVTVRMGSVFRDYGGQILSAVDVKTHPEYKTDQYYPEHNIALVKVNTAIEWSVRVQPVELPLIESELPDVFGETIVTGYGSVVSGQIREGVNQELRRMIVKAVPTPKCRVQYVDEYYLQFDHMCLESSAKRVALCAGDTGNPAVHFTGLKKTGTLYGIALFSGSEECSLKSKPGIFAKVSYSKKWIEEIINREPAADESANSNENTIPIDFIDTENTIVETF